jgi:hypothetical protein
MAVDRRAHLATLLIALAGGLLIAFVAPAVGPVVRAARADGTPGLFEARRLGCVQHPGHSTCIWYGEFRSDDGTRRRGEVYLYGSSNGTLRAGERIRAVDTGRPAWVYRPGGSREWIPTALLLAAGLGLLSYAGRRVLHGVRHRRGPSQ